MDQSYKSISVAKNDEAFIFISYAHKDSDMVLPILAMLRDRQVNIWFDQGIEPGIEWPERIGERVKNALQILVFISPNAVASKNVRREINFAIDQNIPILCVYLQKTELSSGLQLQLGVIQAIHKYKYKYDEEFYQEILKALPSEAISQTNNNEINSKDRSNSHTKRKARLPILSRTAKIIFTIIIIVTSLGVYLFYKQYSYENMQKRSKEFLNKRSKYLIFDINANCFIAGMDVEPKDVTKSDKYKTAYIVFRLIPSGMFKMGSPKNEEGHFEREVQHNVTISRSFYMSIFEITQTQWSSLMKKTPFYFKNSKNADILPAEQVSWKECHAFVEKLNERFSYGKFRLPTEAEWEYACRAGTITPWSFGNNKLFCGDYAWYGSHYWNRTKFELKQNGNAGEKPHPVGLKKANPWGLYDMHGNVWEWCRDRYAEYSFEYLRDPRGGSIGSFRVYRGGGWYNTPLNCRSAYRDKLDERDRSYDLGFRIAFYPN